MEVILSKQALDDIETLVQTDLKTAKRLFRMLREMAKTPYEGLGNPEALKYSMSGLWSRRLSDEHRIVYEVGEAGLIIHTCMGHYGAK